VRRFRAGAALGVALSAAGGLLSSVAALLPAQEYRPPVAGARVVHVGGGDLRREEEFDTGLQVQFMAFYPETMTVHRGQTVEWRFPPGFATLHTVTFKRADMRVTVAPEPREDVHDPLVRADEAPGALALSEDAMLGSGCGLIFADTANGRPAQEPCQLDGTAERYSSQLSDALFNIGATQPQGFAAVIDLPPGRYRYHCNLHPSMHGYLEVVDDRVPLEPQPSIDDASRDALRHDLATARALHRELSTPSSSLDGDRRVWTVHVGGASEDGRVSINDYMPAEVDLEPGDAVHFVHSGVEPHTVTFPSEPVGDFTLQGCSVSTCEGDIVPLGLAVAAAPWACEYDDPAGGLPAVQTWVLGAGCPGGKVEWQLGPFVTDATSAPWNAVETRATFHNSGFMFTTSSGLPRWYTDRPGEREWPETFDAVFPVDGSFTFACQIHTGKPLTSPVTESLVGARRAMIGTIKVRPS
jgi:plastocyanin